MKKGFYDIGYLLKSAVSGKENVNGYSFVYEAYNPQNLFYFNILKRQGKNISFKHYHGLSENDTIIIGYERNVINYIETKYSNFEKQKIKSCSKYVINGKQ